MMLMHPKGTRIRAFTTGSPSRLVMITCRVVLMAVKVLLVVAVAAVAEGRYVAHSALCTEPCSREDKTTMSPKRDNICDDGHCARFVLAWQLIVAFFIGTNFLMSALEAQMATTGPNGTQVMAAFVLQS